MLDQHKFDIGTEISSFVTCIICANLLNDARLGPCGCRYCLKCIANHLASGEKFCPGQTSECREQFICLDNNIYTDAGANSDVSRVEVKCPWECCDYRCRVVQMCDHLRVCDKKLLTCPFREMGCPVSEWDHEKLSLHSVKDIYEHSKLMMAWLMDMRRVMLSDVGGDDTRMGCLEDVVNVIDKAQNLRNDEGLRLRREVD